MLSVAFAWPSLSQAAVSCTIAPPNPTVVAGGTRTWSFASSGFVGTPSRTWSFQGGNPATSTGLKPTVTYATAGSFATGLTAHQGRGCRQLLDHCHG